ncbi:unnamed protein product, partial [Porites evermanni]
MAEAQHNMLSSSGYDEEFVNEVEEDLICFICKLTLREPVQTRCGHRFFNACLEELLRRYDVFPNNATGRKILSLVIKCPREGCSWTGEIRDKEVKTKT